MRRFDWLKLAAFLACLLPLARLGWLAFDDGLGANPIEFVTRSLGTWALVFLLLTLCVTPLRQALGCWPLMRFRRLLGLYAFFYASLHFMSYVWFDQFFDWAAIAKDIAKRPFILMGFASFCLLVPLALTSNLWAMRRLGRWWQRLHRLIYAAAIGGVVHYFWLVKADTTQPLLYGFALALLLGWRVAFFLAKRI